MAIENGIFIATEDELSEAIALKLVNLYCSGTPVLGCLRKNGVGYLRKSTRSFCELARTSPVFLLTDLDQAECAPSFIESWFTQDTPPETLLFRVAVRESEAWLMADHDSVQGLFGSKVTKLPIDPDSLDDPKRHLLHLAKKAPKEVRNDLLPDKGAVSIQGIGYNRLLCNFIETNWNPEVARSRSQSLDRAIKHLRRIIR